jgi:hypothetical protein
MAKLLSSGPAEALTDQCDQGGETGGEEGPKRSAFIGEGSAEERSRQGDSSGLCGGAVGSVGARAWRRGRAAACAVGGAGGDAKEAERELKQHEQEHAGTGLDADVEVEGDVCVRRMTVLDPSDATSWLTRARSKTM